MDFMLSALRNCDRVIWLSVTFLVTYLLVWFSFLLFLWVNKEKFQELINRSPMVLYILTVFLIVGVVTLLGILTTIRGETVAAIYSGIVGYVLGVHKTNGKNQKSKSSGPESKSPIAG